LASKYIADHKPDQIQELIESNVHFPVQIAEAMAAAGTKLLINTGTLSQHYHSHDYNPASLYAATKQACTDILRYYHEARGLSVLTLKLSDTYGPADTRRKLVQLLVDAAVSGERLQMSPGEQILDLTHVDDVVTAFAAAAELLQSSASAVNEEYVVTGERLSVRQLVTLVEQKLDRSIDVHFGARPYRPREIMVPLSPSPEQRLPGWEAQYRLLDTLETLVRPESRAQ
jgi:nucleoside-diphosphate-sugar epimerase